MVPKSSKGKRNLILESNVIREGATSVMPPFEEAVSEHNIALQGDEVAERGFLMYSLCTCIECTDSKLARALLNFKTK